MRICGSVALEKQTLLFVVDVVIGGGRVDLGGGHGRSCGGLGGRGLLVQHAADNGDEQRREAEVGRVLVPHHDVDDDGEELVHHARDRERRGGDSLPRREPEEADGNPEQAAQCHGKHADEPETLHPRRAHHEHLELAVEQPKDRRQHERNQVVVEHEPPRIELDVRYHLLHVDHLRADHHQIRPSPRVRRHTKLRIRDHISHGATQNHKHGSERPHRRKRLLAEHRVGDGDQQRRRGAEHDKSVHIRVFEQVRVGKDGQIEHECGGEEFPRRLPHKLVVRDDAYPSCHHHSDHRGQVLQSCKKRRVRKIRDGELVGHREQA